MAEHTPGPWFLDGNTVHALTTDERGREVDRFWATLSGTRFTPDGQEIRANARLVAAAPDLLEACRVMAAAELHDPSTGIIDADVLEICQDLARAALAKARGP